MSRALVPVPPLDLGELAEAVGAAARFAVRSNAANTLRVYRTQWRQFVAWCPPGVSTLPAAPSTIAVYLAQLAKAGRAMATIDVALASIAYAHKEARLPWFIDETVSRVLEGIRRELGVRPRGAKRALEGDALREAVAPLGEDLAGRRDRALLVLGWFGAFRRSELVALDVEDVVTTRKGLVVTLRRSKGDQIQKGFEKGIPYASTPDVCPVRTLRAWREAAQIDRGPLFRAVDRWGNVSPNRLDPGTIARIVKRAAARLGLDVAQLAGHSLRAGFITSAAAQGKSLETIMAHTGQKDARVVRTYIRPATLFDQNAATGIL